MADAPFTDFVERGQRAQEAINKIIANPPHRTIDGVLNPEAQDRAAAAGRRLLEITRRKEELKRELDALRKETVRTKAELEAESMAMHRPAPEPVLPFDQAAAAAEAVHPDYAAAPDPKEGRRMTPIEPPKAPVKLNVLPPGEVEQAATGQAPIEPGTAYTAEDLGLHPPTQPAQPEPSQAAVEQLAADLVMAGPGDKWKDEQIREWYAAAAKQLGVDDPPPLTAERLDTMMELPAGLRHLMVDPKLNNHGVRAVPDVLHVHTIPKTAGKCELKFYEDIDGQWWAGYHYELHISTRPGANAPVGPCCRNERRYPFKIDALEATVEQLIQDTGRHAGATDSDDKDKGVVRRFIDGLRSFRSQARQRVKEAGGEVGTKRVKHTPAKGPPMPAGPRTAASHRKDTIQQFYVHFKHALQRVPFFEKADPGIDDVGVASLYSKYLAGDGTPADLGREYAALFRVPKAKPKLTKLTNVRYIRDPERKAKARRAKLMQREMTLGAFVAGLKGSLPKGLHEKIAYDKRLQTADAEVVRCFNKKLTVREAAMHLKTGPWNPERIGL